MTKLYRVTVINWGWDSPLTYYANSREEAQAISDRFPGSDGVKYAGRYTDDHAAEILDHHGYEPRTARGARG